MFKPLLACLTAVALPAAALSQQPAAPAATWKVSGSPSGCIAHTTLPQGTVVSVLAGAGQESLLFLIQNRSWELRDGSEHDLAVALDGRSNYKFQAVAKTELDSDGPGLMFAVPPGEQEGARFIAEFAKASGMAVGQDGAALAHVRITGGASAMTELAQCMSRLWGGNAAAQPAEANPAFEGSAARKIKL